MKLLSTVLLAVVLAGCAPLRQRGGGATFSTPDISVGVNQSENPKDATIQEIERITERIPVNDPSVVIRTTERIKTRIGGAQKDLVGENLSKLRGMRPVMFVGIGLFILGAASFAWPPLRALVGSATTSAVIVVAGLALTVLPTVVVGNETLILCIGVGAIVAYWFAHRHGELRGTVKARNGNSQ